MAIVPDTALGTPGLAAETAQPWVLGPDGQVDLSRGFAQADNPQAPDHFAVLGVPFRLLLDPAHLDVRFRSLIRGLHPDRFHVQGPEAEARAQWHTSRVNDAYRALRDLDRRIGYVLELAGQDPAQAAATRFVPPAALLAQVFEFNETLDALQEDPGSAEAQTALAELTGELRERMADLRQRMEAACLQHDDARRRIEASTGAVPSADAALDTALQRLRALAGERTYLTNLLTRAAAVAPG